MEAQIPVAGYNPGNNRTVPSRDLDNLGKGSSDAKDGGFDGDDMDAMEVDHAPAIDLPGYEQPLRLRGGYGGDSPTTQLQLESAQMGVTLSKEAQAEQQQQAAPHELLNNALRSPSTRGKHISQDAAQLLSASQQAQSPRKQKAHFSSTISTSADKGESTSAARSNGQLRRPSYLHEDMSKAKPKKARTRRDDVYDITATPRKSNRANNARLPVKVRRKKAELMPGVGVTQGGESVSVDGDGKEASPLILDNATEPDMGQEAPKRSVTRTVPIKAPKHISHGQQTETDGSFAFTRSAESIEQSAKSQEVRRVLRKRGLDIEVEPVDWSKRPETTARERLETVTSTAGRERFTNQPPANDRSPSQRSAGEPSTRTDGTQVEGEDLQLVGAYGEQERTSTPMNAQSASALFKREQYKDVRTQYPRRSGGEFTLQNLHIFIAQRLLISVFIEAEIQKILSKRWSDLSEGQRQPYQVMALADQERHKTEMANYQLSLAARTLDGPGFSGNEEVIDVTPDEDDLPEEEAPTSTQPPDNDNSPPLTGVEGNEGKEPQSSNQPEFERSGSEDTGFRPENEDQAEFQDEDEDEEGQSGDTEESDGESDVSVSSLGVAVEGLFGQADNFRTIREALRRVGIQKKKDRMIKHKIELSTKEVKGIVKLTAEAIELCTELESIGAEAQEEEIKTLWRKYRRRIFEVKEDVGHITHERAGTKSQAMIEDIYAHAIPKLVQLLVVLVRSHGDAERVESTLLMDDIRAMDIILQLGEKASKWGVRPDPDLTIVKPIVIDVIPCIRTIRMAFHKEMRKRKEDIRNEELRRDRERAERKREIEAQHRAEQHRLDVECSRKNVHEGATRAIMTTDYQSKYRQTRDKASSSQAIHSNADVVRPITPTDKSVWSDDEDFALLEGLIRFTEEDRYRRIVHAYGNRRVPLADRNLGESNAIRDRRLAKRSLDEIIERARELKSGFEDYSRKYKEPLADWMLSI
ncbi:MAG: hypothetical protein M1836_008107 [Candelina mexicana]|nr:MAG: hypothetical protein M1836_008107 [Candelina mexicana]